MDRTPRAAEQSLLPRSSPRSDPDSRPKSKFRECCSAMQQAGQKLKLEMVSLYLALKDKELGHSARGWGARLMIVLVLVVGLGPLDFVPELAPITAFLADVIVLPLLLWLAVRVAPAEALERARARVAAGHVLTLQQDWALAIFIYLLWLLNVLVLVKVICEHSDPEGWAHMHQTKLLVVSGLFISLIFALLVLWRLNVEEAQTTTQQQQQQGQQVGARLNGSPGPAVGSPAHHGSATAAGGDDDHLDATSEDQPLLAKERLELRSL